MELAEALLCVMVMCYGYVLVVSPFLRMQVVPFPLCILFLHLYLLLSTIIDIQISLALALQHGTIQFDYFLNHGASPEPPTLKHAFEPPVPSK